jgi:hypothetical protein
MTRNTIFPHTVGRRGEGSKLLGEFRRSLLLSLIVVLLGLRANAQMSETPKVALERPGLHHATVEGRFVSPDGAPVSGVNVQLSAGRSSALPLRDSITGQDGRFSFSDVSSAHSPDLRWYPPEQWKKGVSAIANESGSTINVGTIELHPDTAVRATVEVVGRPPLAARERPSVVLRSKAEYGRQVSSTEDGVYRLFRQIPVDEGTWGISLFTGNRIERYEAPFRVQRGRRDVLVRLRLLRETLKIVDKYSATGILEVHEESMPSAPVEQEFRARGRVLARTVVPLRSGPSLNRMHSL